MIEVRRWQTAQPGPKDRATLPGTIARNSVERGLGQPGPLSLFIPAESLPQRALFPRELDAAVFGRTLAGNDKAAVTLFHPREVATVLHEHNQGDQLRLICVAVEQNEHRAECPRSGRVGQLE